MALIVPGLNQFSIISTNLTVSKVVFSRSAYSINYLPGYSYRCASLDGYIYSSTTAS